MLPNGNFFLPPPFDILRLFHSLQGNLQFFNPHPPRRKSPPPISRTPAPSSRLRPWKAHSVLIQWRLSIVGSHQVVWPNPLAWGLFRLAPLSSGSSSLTSFVETIHKGFTDPDNHSGVVTHLETDILKCEIKWALGSITTNKSSRSDGIPAELFQILKDDAGKALQSICQQIWKLSSGYRTWESQFSFQSQKKVMPKNVQTTAQLHSSHTLVK